MLGNPKSNNAYNSIFNSCLNAILLTSTDGKILSANPSAKLLFGYSEDELIKLDLSQLFDIADYEYDKLDIMTLQGKEVSQLTLVRKDGTKFKSEISIDIFKDDDDKSILIIKDTLESMVQKRISELEQMNEELKNQIEKRTISGNIPKYQANILENVNDAIIVTDKDFKINLWNRAAERLYGWSAEDVVGKNVQEILRNRYHDATIPEMVDALVENGSFRGEVIQSTKNNISIILESTVMAVKEGDSTIGYVTVNRDITERKKTEKKLKDHTELLNLAHEAILVRDLDSRILFWNDGAKEMYGYSQDEALNKVSHNLLQTKFPTSIKDLDLELIHKKKWSGELVHTKQDGKQIIIASRQSLKVDDNGNPISFLEINNNISERKIAEIELKIYQENLEEKVIERTKALELSNKELQQFAYVASHDLKEPLRMITSFLQLLERQYKDKLDENANEFIEFAVNGAKRLDSMINDLLDYSRVANREREFNNVNFNKVLEQTKLNLKSSINDTNASITYNPLPTLFGDEQLMVQLFQNLISNSIKYRSNETPKIEISVLKESNHYLFKVEDNGIGMSPKNLERIFTIFQRLHTKDEYEGTGIGLAIAQKIVHQHDGHIWAESELGEGTTLYFTIPT
jgi:PAS domain S-box-containing protein